MSMFVFLKLIYTFNCWLLTSPFNFITSEKNVFAFTLPDNLRYIFAPYQQDETNAAQVYYGLFHECAEGYSLQIIRIWHYSTFCLLSTNPMKRTKSAICLSLTYSSFPILSVTLSTKSMFSDWRCKPLKTSHKCIVLFDIIQLATMLTGVN